MLDVFFGDGQTYINKLEILSLSSKKHLINNVVDVWSSILNSQELKKFERKVKRFFFTTYAFSLLFSKVNTCNSTEAEKIVSFKQRLETELDFANVKNLVDVDLVFFPVICNEHFYLIVVNNLANSVEIVDNRTLPRNISRVKKYRNCPEYLLKSYAEFVYKDDASSCKRMYEYKVHLMNMKWRGKTNHNDCGIFLLKHMETYMGQSVNEWDIGLTKNSKEKEFRKLRVQYCWTILLNPRNELLGEIDKKSKEWAVRAGLNLQ
ncbi:uncharacterized protein [Euphorbia lathyris]|uniref:uncharacterized protein n=1 Tax=Euphorbia lathyris TaxID=212925 RepID=UPI00331317E9